VERSEQYLQFGRHVETALDEKKENDDDADGNEDNATCSFSIAPFVHGHDPQTFITRFRKPIALRESQWVKP
jgi:hypothetical protein